MLMHKVENNVKCCTYVYDCSDNPPINFCMLYLDQKCHMVQNRTPVIKGQQHSADLFWTRV